MSGSVYNAVEPSLKLKKRKKTENSGQNSAERPEMDPCSASAAPGELNKTHTTEPSPNDWPPALQQFVQDSFGLSATFSEKKKALFQSQLLLLITLALTEKKLWTNDWARQRLPVLHGGSSDIKLTPKVTTLPHTPSIANKSTAASIERPTTPSVQPPVHPADISTKYDSKDRKRQRMQRFGTESPQPLPSRPDYSFSTPDAISRVIVGSCQDLEKHYLRLTSEPDPSRVRPEPVLHKSLAFILAKYKQKTADAAAGLLPSHSSPYSYLNDQFKSIRQDLTVQHIKNDFTIHVYETHGRIAIENNDLGEFNQCQSQLKFLYALKRKQGGVIDENFLNLELEFICYRILYMLMTGNNSEIYKIKLEIYNTPDTESKKNRISVRFYKCVEALFNLQSCIIRGNYYHFFRIYRFLKSKSYMRLACKLIENFLIEKQRIRTLNILSRLYRKVSIQYLLEVLDYVNKGEDEFMKFLNKYKLDAFVSNGDFDCVQSRAVIQGIVVQQGFKKIDIKGQV